MNLIGNTFFEKLTFWLAISMIPSFMFFDNYIFFVFEILFLLLWVGGGFIE